MLSRMKSYLAEEAAAMEEYKAGNAPIPKDLKDLKDPKDLKDFKDPNDLSDPKDLKVPKVLKDLKHTTPWKNSSALLAITASCFPTRRQKSSTR
jgi:hypothetical protein